MTRNYQLVYYVAENVGIIGILAYPKIRYFYYHNLLFPLDNLYSIVNVESQSGLHLTNIYKTYVVIIDIILYY